MSLALVLLAAGRARRFGEGDKLLADLDGMAVGASAARLMRGARGVHRLAVVPENMPERANLFRETGWQLVMNPMPDRGQASSIALGVRAALDGGADAVILALGDMAFVTDATLERLCRAAPGRAAVMCRSGETLLPPAYFTSRVLGQLMALEGDRGAKRVFESLANTATVALSGREACDIDTMADLRAARHAPGAAN